MLSRAFSYAAKLKTSLAEAADSFEHEQRTWLQQKRVQDGALFTEEEDEQQSQSHPSSTDTPVLVAAEHLKKTLLPIRDLITKALPELNPDQPSDVQYEEKVEEGEKRKSGGKVRMPWDDADNPAAMKSHVLALSLNRKAFLEPPPDSVDGYTFDLESSYPVIMELLRIDSALAQLRFDLVPKKMKEPQFWRTYFYRIHLLRLDPASHTPLPSPTPAQSGSPADSATTLLFSAPATAERSPPRSPILSSSQSQSESQARPQPIPTVHHPHPAVASFSRTASFSSSSNSNGLPTAQELRDELPDHDDDNDDDQHHNDHHLHKPHVEIHHEEEERQPPPPQTLADDRSDYDAYAPEEFVSDMYDDHEWQQHEGADDDDDFNL
ncbi:hypothetical protein DFJ77DRAFT_450331 [Powellomyces hirtus]|nr:hypothetical protein DFJ77DRAFT_450331 [Powellomyces hirtus]